MEYVDIGERIKKRRMELGVSAADLAESLSMSKATIHRYENGEIKNIKLPVIESIARELRANPLWLIGKSEQREAGSMDDGDLLVMIDELIEYAKRTSSLTGEQRSVIVSSLTLIRSYLSDI